MLPELEKGIAKPLKKRYRDLFEDDGNPPSDISNVAANTIGTLAYPEASHRIPATMENIDYQQLHRPTNLYRKSVINRSIKEAISIIDIEQMTPKLADSADAPMRREDQAKFQLETDENQTSHFVYMSDNYLMNSRKVQFMGKLKVKWRKKYENYGNIADMNGIDLNERSANVFDNFNDYGCVKNKEKNRSTGDYISKRENEDARQTARLNVDTDAEDRTSGSDKTADQSEEVPVVRKLERARKGLIYQKYMADAYSWNKKEKNSCPKSTNTEVTQPRKRGRPRINPEGAKCLKNTEDDINESAATVVRLERKKNSDTMKYAVVERKNSKKSLVVKKPS